MDTNVSANATAMAINSTSVSNTGLSPLSPSIYLRSWFAWVICTLITNVFGVLANATLMFITLTYKKIRDSSSSVLILHCIALDLYISLVAAPVDSLLGYLGPGQWLPRNFCHYYGLLSYSWYYVHVWASCVLAFQRLMATLMPHTYDRRTRKPVLAVMIATPWLLILVMQVFPLVGIGIRFIRPGNQGGCTIAPLVEDHGSPVRLFIFYTFCTYLPTVLTGLFYVIILARTVFVLRRRSGTVGAKGADTRTSTANILKRRLQISKMLFLSFLWFCAAQYPLTIAAIFFGPQRNASIALNLTTRYLMMSYSSLNPVIVMKRSSTMRWRSLFILRVPYMWAAQVYFCIT